MQHFPNTTFSPDVIGAATSALHATVNSLPEPVSSTHVNLLTQIILRTASAGERNVTVLQTIALLELQRQHESK